MSEHEPERDLGESIRTLTSLLHKFKVQKSPTKRPKDVLSFLQHFTTLLTCGDKNDPHAKKVIAVTGSVSPGNKVQTLVVAQNPHPKSQMEAISLESVKKDKKTLQEVVDGPQNATLLDHVADVWSALSAFDRTAKGRDHYTQLKALQLFFLSRSYRKFAVRFREDSTLCGGRRLHDIIREWQPDRPEISPKWVAPPRWLLKLQDLPTIKSRTTQGLVEWEFSDETKQAWSIILATLLLRIDDALEETKGIRSNTKATEEETLRAMHYLGELCRVLWFFVHWDEGIMKAILTKTNVVESITTKFQPMASVDEGETDRDDDAAQFRQEPGESKGQQVFRYLKTVVAWHEAAYCLAVDKTLPKLLENVEIGLVEVPSSASSILPLDQVTRELIVDFPDMADFREDVKGVLKQHYPDKFSGCVHAEATLMGLLNHYSHRPALAGHSPKMVNQQDMRNIIEPVAAAGNAVIAVSKKCCWCCDWLGLHLETQFQLPGTHGIMYPWDPPLVGISISVLKKLEKELWQELYRVVSCEVSLGYSRQSSAVSSPTGHNRNEMDFDVDLIRL